MKETLELIDKYGIKPLLFLAILYLYSENNQNKQDIKEVQALLVDCYKSQSIANNDFNVPLDSVNYTLPIVAILPGKPCVKTKKKCV